MSCWTDSPVGQSLKPGCERIHELLAGVAAGDDDAFGTLYDILAPRVWDIARTAAGGGRRAENATVQAFADMRLRAGQCPTDPDAAIGWALAIAVRRSTVLADRRRQRPENESARGVHRTRRRPAWWPGSGGNDGRQDEAVSSALFELSPRQRDAILLTCCGRLTVRQAACALGTAQQDVADVLRAGLVRLRGRLPVGGHPRGRWFPREGVPGAQIHP